MNTVPLFSLDCLKIAVVSFAIGLAGGGIVGIGVGILQHLRERRAR